METASIMGAPTNHGKICFDTCTYAASSHIGSALYSHENLNSPPQKMIHWEHVLQRWERSSGTNCCGSARKPTSLTHNKKPAFTRACVYFLEGFRSCWKRYYFPIQKLAKIRVNKSSLVNSPVISPSAFCASRNSSATSSPAWTTSS